MSTISKTERVTQLMNSRRGKKGSITKRITQIDRIVGDGGSRSQVTYLIEALAKVQESLQAVCEELLNLAPDTDSEWLDNENMRIDTCISEAKGYLERRRDDPPSADALTESWVQKHAADNDLATLPGTEGREDEISLMTNRFAQFGASHQYGESSTAKPLSDFLKPAHLSWTNADPGIFLPSEQQFVRNISQNNAYTASQAHSYEDQNRLPYSYSSWIDNPPAAPTTTFAVSGSTFGTRPTPSVGDGLGRQQYNASLPPPVRSQRSDQYVQRPQNHVGVHQNQVDSWIDVLTELVVAMMHYTVVGQALLPLME